MLCCLSTDQNLTDLVVINGFQQIVSIAVKVGLLTLYHLQLLDDHFRGHNVTAFNQLRSRNFADNLTVDSRIIHSWFANGKGMFRCGREEIAASCVSSKILSSREKVTLNAVMCLIKIDRIDINLCHLKTRQRVVGGYNQAVIVSVCINPVANLPRASGGFVVSFSTVNVEDFSISDELKKLSRELLCKQNTRSNNNNGLRSFRLQLAQSIIDHLESLATTSRHNNLTFDVLKHCSDSTFLMRTELDLHWSHYLFQGHFHGPSLVKSAKGC